MAINECSVESMKAIPATIVPMRIYDGVPMPIGNDDKVERKSFRFTTLRTYTINDALGQFVKIKVESIKVMAQKDDPNGIEWRVLDTNGRFWNQEINEIRGSEPKDIDKYIGGLKLQAYSDEDKVTDMIADMRAYLKKILAGGKHRELDSRLPDKFEIKEYTFII